MKKMMVCIGVLAIAGCAGSPARLGMMNEGQLSETKWVDLCNAYAHGKHKNERIRTELKKRDVELAELHDKGLPDPVSGDAPRTPFTEREWEAIDQAKIFIGMSEPALICSWGLPNTFSGGTINRSVGAGGERRQYVYRATQYGRANYVYVRNGYVTSWQN